MFNPCFQTLNIFFEPILHPMWQLGFEEWRGLGIEVHDLYCIQGELKKGIHFKDGFIKFCFYRGLDIYIHEEAPSFQTHPLRIF